MRVPYTVHQIVDRAFPPCTQPNCVFWIMMGLIVVIPPLAEIISIVSCGTANQVWVVVANTICINIFVTIFIIAITCRCSKTHSMAEIVWIIVTFPWIIINLIESVLVKNIHWACAVGAVLPIGAYIFAIVGISVRVEVPKEGYETVSSGSEVLSDSGEITDPSTVQIIINSTEAPTGK